MSKKNDLFRGAEPLLEVESGVLLALYRNLVTTFLESDTLETAAKYAWMTQEPGKGTAAISDGIRRWVTAQLYEIFGPKDCKSTDERSQCKVSANRICYECQQIVNDNILKEVKKRGEKMTPQTVTEITGLSKRLDNLGTNDDGSE